MPKGDEQRVQGHGDRIGGDGRAELMDPVSGGVNDRGEEVPVELDQERDDRAAGASELMSPASVYWLDQAVAAKDPHPVAGLRGLQRHPVLFLVRAPKFTVAEPGDAVLQGEECGQQGLLRRALWPNSGIATPRGIRTAFDQRLVSTRADRRGHRREASPLQPPADGLPQAGQILQVGQALVGHKVRRAVHDEFEPQDEALLVVALQPVASVEGLEGNGL